jgi:plasmid stabilization system protein ParE
LLDRDDHDTGRAGRPVTTAATWIAPGLAALALIAAAAPSVTAGPATDTLRPAIDQVLRILEDPALKGPARARERQAALRTVMETVIDFPDAGRRALSVHWQARTEAEREEFVILFKDLVTYRAQFNTIVRTSSYAELIHRIRGRVAELTAPPASTSRSDLVRGTPLRAGAGRGMSPRHAGHGRRG